MLHLGVAELDPEAPSRQELVAAADAPLYRAKRGGKNRVERAAAPASAPRSTVAVARS